MRNFSAAQREEFQKAADFLRKNYNAIVTTALEFFEGFDVTAEGFSKQKDFILRKRMAAVSEADRVVYLTDYEQDLDATQEVRTAKHLNIRVNGITSMTKSETQNENRNITTDTSSDATSVSSNN